MDRPKGASTAAYPPVRRDVLRAGCRAIVSTVGFGWPQAARAETRAKRVPIVQSFGREFASYNEATSSFRLEVASRVAEGAFLMLRPSG